MTAPQISWHIIPHPSFRRRPEPSEFNQWKYGDITTNWYNHSQCRPYEAPIWCRFQARVIQYAPDLRARFLACLVIRSRNGYLPVNMDDAWHTQRDISKLACFQSGYSTTFTTHGDTLNCTCRTSLTKQRAYAVSRSEGVSNPPSEDIGCSGS